MKIIITGANGYLGSCLIKYFSKFNYEILGIYRKKLKLRLKKKNVKYLQFNLLKKIPVKIIKDKYDVMLHFAGPKNDRLSVTKNRKKILQSIKIDKNVINFSKKIKIKKIIFASSSAVYNLNEGLNKNINNFVEKKAKLLSNCDGIYGICKKITENYLEKICSNKIKTISCRIFSVYGKNTKTIINIWKKKIKQNQKIIIWKNKKIIRSWLHIEDFLSGIHCILRSKKANGAINIGSDELTSFEDIINIIKNKYKKKIVKFEINKDKDPGPPIRYSNQNKLKKLGWRQKIYLNEGLNLI